MLANDLSSLLGLVVGLVSIIVSVFLSFRSKTRKILEYKIESVQLMTKKMTSIPKLKITIDGQPIKTLTSTKITFFNAGNQSIVLSDFAIKEPLGLTITGWLYSYGISADNSNSIPTLQLIDDKTFHISFDFLKQKQSFSITLLLDGTVTIFGELTNGERRQYRNIFSSSKVHLFVYILTLISIIMSVIFNLFIPPFLTEKHINIHIIYLQLVLLGVVIIILVHLKD